MKHARNMCSLWHAKNKTRIGKREFDTVIPRIMVNMLFVIFLLLDLLTAGSRLLTRLRGPLSLQTRPPSSLSLSSLVVRNGHWTMQQPPSRLAQCLIPSRPCSSMRPMRPCAPCHTRSLTLRVAAPRYQAPCYAAARLLHTLPVFEPVSTPDFGPSSRRLISRDS